MRVSSPLVLFIAVVGCKQDSVTTPVDAAVHQLELAGHRSLSDSAGATVGEIEDRPGHALSRVGAGILLGDGGFILMDRGSAAVYRYRADGELLQQIGRQGQGPGEYAWLRNLFRIGDNTIALWDAGLRRITTWDADGTTTTLALGSGGVGPGRGSFYLDLYPLGRGRWLGAAEFPDRSARGRPGELHSDSLLFAFIDSAGETSGVIGSIASYQSYNTERETIGAPYGERLYVGTAGGRIYMATGTRARVTELDSTGTPSRVLHLPVARLPITSRHLELSRERFLLRFRPGDRASVSEWFAEAPKPDSFPAFTALQAASDGTVWLYRYAFDRDTEPSEWIIVSPEHGTFETVTLPPGTTVLDADGNRLLVLQHTDLDVPRVSVLHLNAKTR